MYEKAIARSAQSGLAVLVLLAAAAAGGPAKASVGHDPVRGDGRSSLAAALSGEARRARISARAEILRRDAIETANARRRLMVDEPIHRSVVPGRPLWLPKAGR